MRTMSTAPWPWAWLPAMGSGGPLGPWGCSSTLRELCLLLLSPDPPVCVLPSSAQERVRAALSQQKLEGTQPALPWPLGPKWPDAKTKQDTPSCLEEYCHQVIILSPSNADSRPFDASSMSRVSSGEGSGQGQDARFT